MEKSLEEMSLEELKAYRSRLIEAEERRRVIKDIEKLRRGESIPFQGWMKYDH